MLKTVLLSGILLLTSTGLSLGTPNMRADTKDAFKLTIPGAPARPSHGLAARHPDRSITRANDGLFYVDATVNGRPVHFIVDTGSNVVVLTKRDAERVGMRPSADELVGLHTLGGAIPMKRGSIDRIIVAGQTLENVDSARVDNHLNVSLLGQSALSQLQSVSFVGDRLKLN